MNCIDFDEMAREKLEMYQNIIKRLNKTGYGTFHKCQFHLHTPASYDYNLYDTKNENYYLDLTEKELFDISIREGLVPSGFGMDYFKYDSGIFITKKEFLSYLLIAHTLCNQGIELVVISDHNTIDGYTKLYTAINLYTTARSVAYKPVVILGIEISCADRLHIVSLFPYSLSTVEKINQFIKDYIMSKKDGTFLTSYDVLNKIHEIGGISYIAHINTSNIFKKEYLSGLYRTKLLNSKYLNVIGLTDPSQLESINNEINRYRDKSEVCYVLDSDSHSIDTIGKNSFWIKGQRCSFNMIEKAIRDFSISLQLEKPEKPRKFIKGIAVNPSKTGFLSGKDTEMFCLTFSEDLNCLIGGRGTGKSTIINSLIFVLSQQCSSESILNSICSHEYIMIVYHYNGDDYVVFFTSPPTEYNYDTIANRFNDYINYSEIDEYYTDRNRRVIRKNIQFDKKAIAKIAFKYCILVYKVRNKSFLTVPEKDKKALLSEFFNVGYSINELVTISMSNELDKFIVNLLFKNGDIERLNDLSKVYSKTSLLSKIKEIEDNLKLKEIYILNIINNYNEAQKGKLRINFTFDFRGFFDSNNLGLSKFEYFGNFNIRNEALYDYLEFIDSEIGILELLKLFLNKKYAEINHKYPIMNHADEMSQKLIDKGIKTIDDDNLFDVYELIGKKLLSQECIKNINYALKKLINNCEHYDLEFNVNNKESFESAKESYVSIRKLSLGQKVVALLSFILSYGEFCNDYTPLIIDQPEDNLDNQYIYKNLVKDLRDIKVKRQVIIATHSSTIVTNAKAEQVIVMESDDQKGWVQDTGFPTERKIIRHILNYLEGGVESFNHKSYIYQDVTTPKN